MNFGVVVKYGMKGAPVTLPDLSILDYNVDAVGGYVGSYDILEMGAHFHAYMENPRQLLLPTVHGLPHAAFFQSLRYKNRASTVTGNLGETLAAIVASRCLECGIQDIAHITTLRPFSRRKVPDYLVRIGGVLPPVLMANLPAAMPQLPHWLALESKASRDQNTARGGSKAAFQQLAAYWYTIHAVAPQEVGFGLIVSTVYEHPASITLYFLSPTNQAALGAVLAGYATYQDFYDDWVNANHLIRASLHGC